MGKIAEKETSLMKKNQVKEELESSCLVYQLGREWSQKFIIELSPYARHCVIRRTYNGTNIL